MTKTLEFVSPDPGMTFKVIEVTPAIAIEWLKRNYKHNRTINKAAVARYEAEMKASAWRLTHQAIAFDAEGNLIDGQHRLKAVIASGMTVTFLVVYYTSNPPIEALDRGATRTMGAVLDLSGDFAKGHGAAIASIANAMACLVSGTVRGVRALRPEQIRKAYKDHQGGIDFAASLLRPGKITSPFAGAAAYTHPICPQRIESLFRQAINSEGLSMYSGAWHLNRLLALQSQTHAQRLENAQAAVKCVMLHIKDREVKLFKVAVEGSLDGMAWAEKERTKLGLFTGMWAPEVAS